MSSHTRNIERGLLNTKHGLMENVPCMMLQAKPLPTPKEQGASARRLTGCCWREGKTLLCFIAAAFPIYIPSAFAHIYPFSAGLPRPASAGTQPCTPPTTLHTHRGKLWLPGAQRYRAHDKRDFLTSS